MVEFSFIVKARWYANPDCFGESYVITGDNRCSYANLEIGRKYHASIRENLEGNLLSQIGRVKDLLGNLKAMQSVGMDGKQFLVVGGIEDLNDVKREINHVLELIDAFDNDSNRRNGQTESTGEIAGD